METLAQAWNASWPVAIAAGALTVVATGRVLDYLRRKQILDLPNERSSHTLPTPRGGGLATSPVMAVLLIALGWWDPALRPSLVLGLGGLALLAVSWLDDRFSLPVTPRFAAHTGLIAVFLATLPEQSLVLQGFLPVWADRIVAGLGWLWFVNLYNFMDGIDGITGSHTAGLGLGLMIAAALSGAFPLMPSAAVAGAVGLGFLVWNWHPAKLFLGDSGSVPLGYVLGGLLLLLAVHGQLAAALILPAYYLADATITLVRRAANRERIWQAHRKHFYQRAVQGGKRHDQVVLAIAVGHASLIACAAATTQGWLWTGSLGALITVALLLTRLQSWSTGSSS